MERSKNFKVMIVLLFIWVSASFLIVAGSNPYLEPINGIEWKNVTGSAEGYTDNATNTPWITFTTNIRPGPSSSKILNFSAGNLYFRWKSDKSIGENRFRKIDFFKNGPRMPLTYGSKTGEWNLEEALNINGSEDFRLDFYYEDFDSQIWVAFPVGAENKKPRIINFRPDIQSPQKAGTIIKWTTEASDFENNSTNYCFFLNDESVTGWIQQNQWIWNTTVNDIGENQIKVSVGHGNLRDDNCCDIRSMNFTITAEPPNSSINIYSNELCTDCVNSEGFASVQEQYGANYSWNVTGGEIIGRDNTHQINYRISDSTQLSININVTKNNITSINYKNIGINRKCYCLKPPGLELQHIINMSKYSAIYLSQGDYDAPIYPIYIGNNIRDLVIKKAQDPHGEARIICGGACRAFGLEGTHNISIVGLDLSMCSRGISLKDSVLCNITSNNITFADRSGIYLDNCSSIFIKNNNIISNNGGSYNHCILIDNASKYNRIDGNHFNCHGFIIGVLNESTDNTIYYYAEEGRIYDIDKECSSSGHCLPECIGWPGSDCSSNFWWFI